MNTSIIILLCVLAYVLIGCAVRAAYLCYHTDSRGHCSWVEKDNATIYGMLWLILIVVSPIFGLTVLVTKFSPAIGWVSDWMYKLCQKHKK